MILLGIPNWITLSDVAVCLLCIAPTGALAYACCYSMLLALHPNEHEYAVFAAYGFIQFSLGCCTGFGTARLMYHPLNTPTTDNAIMEEAPLLSDLSSLASADNVETFAA
jgi:hypothetical protein